jgi:hypothetical protein
VARRQLTSAPIPVATYSRQFDMINESALENMPPTPSTKLVRTPST